MLVLSTALFDLPPYEILIVHGLILAEDDDQKMSKRKKNYRDPLKIVNLYRSKQSEDESEGSSCIIFFITISEE